MFGGREGGEYRRECRRGIGREYTREGGIEGVNKGGRTEATKHVLASGVEDVPPPAMVVAEPARVRYETQFKHRASYV